ncbi:TonB-dependent receptor [Prevotella sp. 10(H)]|uniref:SusC/RagA family TonB-linked outer membrane protein n=1 Tax=Prevotella sp. 10(H) TaxID=1158294 RepID=UPI0004A76178|nr:TonB-dependent receptor [Prevotella sp. 10(H)]
MMSFFIVCHGAIYAQNKVVTGKIIDEISNEPLIGVTIKEQSSPTNGTITNIDGEFSITVQDNSTLEISYMGYVPQKISVAGKSRLEILLKEDSKILDEIVVVGYGTQSRRNMTGAVSDIKSDDITRTASTTMSGALAGKLPGISVRSKNARPGYGAQLEVRNMGNPLIIIDGIPYGGAEGRNWVGAAEVGGLDAFNALNPEDIESITILKDASAAIYGLRASNGVVLVTTKKGNEGKPTININGYIGWQNLTRFPKLANAAQYTRGLVEAAQNQGADPSLVYTKEELAKWQAGTEPGYKSYDYYDIVMRKNIPQHHLNANVSGGTKNSNYYLSVSNTRQEALMKDFNYDRTNIQVNLESNIIGGLTVGAQISGRQEKTEDVGLPGGDGYFSAILGMFKMVPTVGPYANDNPEYINNTREIAYNPALFSRDIAGYKDNLNRNANINLYAQYKFKFGLNVKGTVSYNYTNGKFDGFQYTYDAYTYDKTTDTYNKTGGLTSRWRLQEEREVVSKYGQFQIDYAKQLGDHYFSVLGAYERSNYNKDHLWLGTIPTNDYLPLLQYNDMSGMGDGWNYEARVGYIGKINYNYKGKYLVELLGRYDGSYLYAKGNRFGFFPGVSVGWRISDENFFKPLKTVVSDLKLRASMGETGVEQGVGMFDYLGGYTWNQGGAVLDGEYVTGMKPRGLPITNLSWVTNRNTNFGIDAFFFNEKLKLTADMFRITRSGVPAQRYDVLLPSEVGYSLPNENLNKNGYRGFEGMISYTDKVNDLNYTVSGNFTYSRYRSIETYKPRFGNAWDEYRNSAEDRWGGIWWGYQVIGRFQSEDEIRNHPINNDGENNRTQLPGDFIYKDVNGDGIINDMDMRPIGYSEGWAPVMSFGGHIGLEWKGIDLAVDFAGGAMQSWFQDYELRNPFHAGGNSPAYLLEDRWHRADPYDINSEWISGYYPAIRNGNTKPNDRNSDFWLKNVHYLRIKNLEVGYNLPVSIRNAIHAQKVRVYMNVSNLLSFDNVRKLEIDPEIEARAAVVYPQQRTILLGFNITF